MGRVMERILVPACKWERQSESAVEGEQTPDTGLRIAFELMFTVFPCIFPAQGRTIALEFTSTGFLQGFALRRTVDR